MRIGITTYLKSLLPRYRDQHAAVGVANGTIDFFRIEIIQDIEQIDDIEADIQRFAGVVHDQFFFRLFLLGIAANDAQGIRRQYPAYTAEFLVR